MFIPIVNVAAWEQETRTEVRGHNTTVPVPLVFCPRCVQTLHRPRLVVYLLAAVAVLVAAGVVCYFSGCAGVTLGFVGLVVVSCHWLWRATRWQGDLKGMLDQVPAYSQLLDQYPHAIVRVPKSQRTSDRDR